MLQKNIIALSFLLTTFLIEGHSQKKISFGKVSMEELLMKRYEPDTTAGAVVISDIGKLSGIDAKFTRHIRIKILNKSGLDWGNWTFRTPTKGFFNVLVFNLSNGEITKDKADNNSIYKEEIIKNFKVYKVFAPNVKVGSVIDISFSFFGTPFEWRFQERIPIIYSELTLEENEVISYSKYFLGLQPIETISPTSWRAQNMPAFKIEPYTNNYSNYISKFIFQITSFSIPGTSVYVAFSTSWKNINNNLLDDPNFGGVLNESNFLNEFAKKLKADSLSTKEKVNSAVHFIQSKLKWNKVKSVIATDGLRSNFLTSHSGNSAEINLALITLLNKAGITTYPVVLSTRDNGLLPENFPSLDKLNYVVGRVQYEGVELLIDATSDFISVGNLPSYCLNGSGLLVKRETEQWVTLNRNEFIDTKKEFISLKIDSDGKAKAKVTQEFIGYGYINWSEEQLLDNNDKDLRKQKIQLSFPGIEILTYELNKSDPSSSMSKEALTVDFSNQVVDAGDEVIFSPFSMYEYTSNPFRSEERNYPIDLLCNKEINTTMIIQLPNELKVKQLPESIKVHTPDGNASFTYLANNSNNVIQFKLTLKINKHVFSEIEYLELRNFFSQVIKAVNTPLQFTKS